MPLKIPERERPRLARLMRTTADVRNALLTTLGKCKPSLGQRGIIEEAVSALAGTLDAASVRDIVSFIVSLYWVRADSNVSAETLAADVVLNAQDAADPELQNPHGGWQEFERFLVQLLSLDETVGLSAKALFLVYQEPRHYHKGRILSDARPIFVSAPEAAPALFVLRHTLQIEFHENGKDQEWFISMDIDDLKNLRNVVDRALEKHRSLSTLLQKTEVPVLSWTENYDVDES